MKFTKNKIVFLNIIIIFNVGFIIDRLNEDPILTFLFLIYFNSLYHIVYSLKGDSK